MRPNNLATIQPASAAPIVSNVVNTKMPPPMPTGIRIPSKWLHSSTAPPIMAPPKLPPTTSPKNQATGNTTIVDAQHIRRAKLVEVWPFRPNQLDPIIRLIARYRAMVLAKVPITTATKTDDVKMIAFYWVEGGIPSLMHSCQQIW